MEGGRTDLQRAPNGNQKLDLEEEGYLIEIVKNRAQLLVGRGNTKLET